MPFGRAIGDQKISYSGLDSGEREAIPLARLDAVV